MCDDVTEDALLDYFYRSGGDAGKVRNADLLKTYKPLISHQDLQLRGERADDHRPPPTTDHPAANITSSPRRTVRTLATVSWDAPSPPSPAAPPAQTLAPRDPAPAAPPAQTLAPRDPAPALLAGDEDGGGSDGGGAPPGGPESTEPNECADPPSSQEYESEHDDDSLENMGSTSVALDPIEKDWIYSAACARVSDLSELLQQDPSLANKKEALNGVSSSS
ncbi:hypothetical protein CRUP_029231 [Coryphaenoides rupestris]|nr:hypothetical protein CRUP_029231 [Coryphaenoides rupestris]